MKRNWLSLALTFVPSLAFADHGGMMEQCAGHMGKCGHSGAFGVLALGAAAGLGYWVLRHAVKDSGAVRWAGQAVGWVLVAGGLAGFLASGFVKMKAMCPKSGSGAMCPFSGKPM